MSIPIVSCSLIMGKQKGCETNQLTTAFFPALFGDARSPVWIFLQRNVVLYKLVNNVYILTFDLNGPPKQLKTILVIIFLKIKIMKTAVNVRENSLISSQKVNRNNITLSFCL